MKHVRIEEQYQQGYEYTLTEPIGKNFREDFKPELTPEQMLKLGVFGGDYFNEVPAEFPASWFEGVTLSPGGADKQLNFFKVNASQRSAERNWPERERRTLRTARTSCTDE